MNRTLYAPLIFELSRKGREGYSLPSDNLGQDKYKPCQLPAHLLRQEAPASLPEVDELTAARHYTNMSGNNFGVDTGFYPLGSCTMKYNPKINEEVAALPGFTDVHPAQPAETLQGSLHLYHHLAVMLAEVGGMHAFTLNPYAGAHGELTGLMVIRTYHQRRGDHKRVKIIVPDSAHGTNPASAAVCGLQIVQVKSTEQGTVDLEDLRTKLGDDIA
ncbi:MAG: aminomethyl-transferring glycine dehydrogenase subunit GcvPB, partial [Bacteroidales bacterium]